MARQCLTSRSVRGCCSSPRGCWRCVCDNVRLIPVGFILVLQGYAYIILTFSISISYTLIHRRKYLAAALQLILTHALLGGAILSLLLTVLRDPGTPKVEMERPMGIEEALGGFGGGASASGAAESGDVEMYADEQGPHAHESDQAPLLSHGLTDDAHDEPTQAHGLARTSRSGDGAAHTAPLLTSGPSSLIPGQPVLPARTDRDQLFDQLSLAERLAPLAGSAFTASAQLDTTSTSGHATFSRSGQSTSAEAPSQSAVARSGRARAGSTAKMSDLMIKSTGEARWCNKCVGPKPDRAHHCSTCRTCVLRMDHHCPWLGGCVGLRNHKAFFLFLTYTAASCIYALQESARALFRWINDEKNGSDTTPITWAILLLIGFIFGIALVPFAIYHAYLMCRNKTTIESMEDSGRFRLPSDQLRGTASNRPSRVNLQDRLRQVVGSQGGPNAPLPPSARQDSDTSRWRGDEELTREERKALKKANKLNVYDIGVGRNWRMMMGQKWWEWFLPWGSPSSDGFCYDINMNALDELDRITTRIRTGQDPPPQRREHEEPDSDSDSDDGFKARQRTLHVDQGDSTPLGLIRVDSGAESGMTRSEQRRAAAHGRVPLASRQADRDDRWESGHGEAEWGAPPRRDFVLYDVDSEDEGA
ncbi:hypothetical protein V8E36_009738 [Tilletia maclaganii]